MDGTSWVKASYDHGQAPQRFAASQLPVVGDEAFWLTRNPSDAAPVAPATNRVAPGTAPFQVGAKVTIGAGPDARVYVVKTVEPVPAEFGGDSEVTVLVTLKSAPTASQAEHTLRLITGARGDGPSATTKAL
jgi:hypothetical protein